MENAQPLIETSDNTEMAAEQRRPFVEPTLTPAGDVFDVTRRYLFMMQGSLSVGGDDGETG
ncbi:MAG: hypothetical protein HOP19_15560 [Acidobacteria bacterium]|nr:hypothetical protein [Acidobacteriota bacterium]